MRWRGRRESQNIEDRRGDSGGSYGGDLPSLPGGLGRGGFRLPGGSPGGARGGGIGGIVILIVAMLVLWFLGINPLTLIEGLDNGAPPGGTVTADRSRPAGSSSAGRDQSAGDEMRSFVAVVLAETEDVWHQLFRAAGETYEEPTLVLFSNTVDAAGCGFASAASGPFYCPADRKVYLDMAFFEELSRRFGAPGDFADAYVIAHEVGHHVQNLVGILPKYHELRRRMSEAEANALSVRVELQADCFAGVWANRSESKGLLEPGDIDEALNAARQIGDDTLQRRSQGYVVPESFNHGTSAQRARWFKVGFESGRMDACDTFSAENL